MIVTEPDIHQHQQYPSQHSWQQASPFFQRGPSYPTPSSSATKFAPTPTTAVSKAVINIVPPRSDHWRICLRLCFVTKIIYLPEGKNNDHSSWRICFDTLSWPLIWTCVFLLEIQRYKGTISCFVLDAGAPGHGRKKPWLCACNKQTFFALILEWIKSLSMTE